MREKRSGGGSMKPLWTLAPVLLCLLALGGCGTPPQVVQGTVVSYSPETQVLVVRDEVPPHREISLSVAQAEIGGAPEANDIVRVAYREAEGAAVAVRVMNLTKQKELQKGS